MTCIVGIVSDGTVIIGGDSCGVEDQYYELRADEKVFRSGPYLIGYAGSYRMGQILQYGLRLPKPPKRNIHKFMCTTFIDAVREVLNDKGHMKNDEGRDKIGGLFVVGVCGRLYYVDTDLQVGQWILNYGAIGAGRSEALGSLFSTSGMEPEGRVDLALQAAEMFNNTVRRPFVIMRLED